MIEITIWTHIGHPTMRVDERTLHQMQEDAMNKAIGQYRVTWCTDDEHILTVNWANVIMLKYSAEAME